MNFIKTVCLSIILLAMIASCNENPGNGERGMASNETMKTILNRKSVRDYTQKEISKEDLQDLLKAGMAAPSSRDRRPWQFIVISDKEILQSLGGKLKTAAALKGANKAVVVCGDTIISGNCWFLDCSAAAENILLAAESKGIGAVWTAVYPYADRDSIVRQAMELPDHIMPLAIIPLGYPSGIDTPKDKFDESRIHQNKW